MIFIECHLIHSVGYYLGLSMKRDKIQTNKEPAKQQKHQQQKEQVSHPQRLTAEQAVARIQNLCDTNSGAETADNESSWSYHLSICDTDALHHQL